MKNFRKKEMNQSFEDLQTEKKKSTPKMDEISMTIKSSKPDEKKSKLLTLKQAAKLLNQSNFAVYSKVKRGEIPHMKKGKHYYFSQADLVPFIKPGKVKKVIKLEKSNIKNEIKMKTKVKKHKIPVNDIWFPSTILELEEKLVFVKNKWKELKKKENFDFPEYTDDVIKDLEFTITNPEFSDFIIATKGSNIVNELNNIHFKHKLDLDYILSFCPQSSRLIYFNKYSRLLDDKQYWNYLRECYLSTDYNPTPTIILNFLFSADRKHKENLMVDEDIKFFNSLQSTITIYRAMSKKEFESEKFRFSWTLDESVATSFKTRNDMLYGEEHLVHQMKISKKDVMAYFNGREEQEIVYIEKLF